MRNTTHGDATKDKQTGGTGGSGGGSQGTGGSRTGSGSDSNNDAAE